MGGMLRTSPRPQGSPGRHLATAAAPTPPSKEHAMKPDRDLRAAAIALMATVAAVGIARGLMPGPVEASPAAAAGPVLVRPQMTSGDLPEPAGTLHLNARSSLAGAAPQGATGALPPLQHAGEVRTGGSG